jgi:hypothetical protein
MPQDAAVLAEYRGGAAFPTIHPAMKTSKRIARANNGMKLHHSFHHRQSLHDHDNPVCYLPHDVSQALMVKFLATSNLIIGGVTVFESEFTISILLERVMEHHRRSERTACLFCSWTPKFCFVSMDVSS